MLLTSQCEFFFLFCFWLSFSPGKFQTLCLSTLPAFLYLNFSLILSLRVKLQELIRGAGFSYII